MTGNPHTYESSGVAALEGRAGFRALLAQLGQTFEFRAEVFNLLNSTYFNAPNTNVDTAAGGRVTSTSNQARQVQFGFKYVF